MHRETKRDREVMKFVHTLHTRSLVRSLDVLRSEGERERYRNGTEIQSHAQRNKERQKSPEICTYTTQTGLFPH